VNKCFDLSARKCERENNDACSYLKVLIDSASANEAKTLNSVEVAQTVYILTRFDS